MDYTLRDAEFISGIRAQTLMTRIKSDELNASKTGGRWYITHGSLIDLMHYEWERGRIYMNRPDTWQGRVDFITKKRGGQRHKNSKNGRNRPNTTATE